MSYATSRVCAVIPALNEEASVAGVVEGLLAQRSGGTRIVDEVIVGDNGSTDATASVARAATARVVRVPDRGYGAACLGALALVRDADIVVFADADGSIDPRELESLLAALQAGADLAIGSRVHGGCAPGAMSRAQRIGNEIAALCIRALFGARISDLGPFRAIRASALAALDMRDRRFGWTVEMQVKAILGGMRIAEVPVTTRARRGPSKVSGTWRGVARAGYGILSTIVRLRLAHAKRLRDRRAQRGTQEATPTRVVGMDERDGTARVLER